MIKARTKARTKAKNIAYVFSERRGISFSTQSVRNFINKIRDDDEDGKTVEKALGDIIDTGGDVIQTKDMKNILAKCRPLDFECDTDYSFFKLKLKRRLRAALSSPS